MNKIYFVDIDGTILDCNNGLIKPSKKTYEAFDKIKANGDMVFIASGRAKCLLPEEILKLNPSGYILANGAYCEYNNQILFENVMDNNTKCNIIEFTDKYNGAYYLVSDDYIYTKDLKMPLHIEYSSSWFMVDCYKDQGYNDKISINIAMVAFEKDNQALVDIYEELSEFVDINHHGDYYSFDLNIKNVNKGSAITKLIKLLNINYEDTYAFGDGINDIEMMQSVKHSIAMGNAQKELKEVSKEETDTVLNDGLYKYLINNHLIS